MPLGKHKRTWGWGGEGVELKRIFNHLGGAVWIGLAQDSEI